MAREKERRRESYVIPGRLVSTFFFTNFPKEWSEKDLWRFFSKQGVVVDVYVARKLNKDGKRFGFVRFIRVTNEKVFERDLNKIWIGNFKLFVSLEKFKRRSHEEWRRKENAHPATRPNHPVFPKEVEVDRSRKQRSYAEVAKGAIGEVEVVHNEPIQPSSNKKKFRVEVESKDNLDVISYLETHYVAKVRSVQALLNLVDLCILEGMSDFKFKYLGGLWVLIKCPETFSMDDEPRLHGINKWFSSFKPWSKDFEIDERLIWVNIEGVPAKVWNPNTFISIASRWGEVLISEPQWNLSTNLRRGRVCIGSKCSDTISESEEIKVDGKVVTVRISEGESISPSWDTAADASEDSMSDREEEDDDDQWDESCEEDDDSVFIPDSFADEANGDEEAVNTKKDPEACCNSPAGTSPEISLVPAISNQELKGQGSQQEGDGSTFEIPETLECVNIDDHQNFFSKIVHNGPSLYSKDVVDNIKDTGMGQEDAGKEGNNSGPTSDICPTQKKKA